jgi:hypothetical protein
MSDERLESLMVEVKERLALPRPSDLNGIVKIGYTHDAMINLIIADPCVTQNELAARFGYTASWVSMIISSDAFKARLAERSEELVDPTIKATIEERFKGLVLRSLEILREKLDKPAAMIPDQLALRTLELSARAAGYGARTDQLSTPTGDMHVHLENIGEGLTVLLRRKRNEALEGEVLEVGKS